MFINEKYLYKMITKYEQSNINMIIKRKKGSYVMTLPRNIETLALTKFCYPQKDFASLQNVSFESRNFQSAKILTLMWKIMR